MPLILSICLFAHLQFIFHAFPSPTKYSFCSFLRTGLTMCSWLSSALYINIHIALYCMSGFAVIMVLKYSLGMLKHKTVCRWERWKWDPKPVLDNKHEVSISVSRHGMRVCLYSLFKYLMRSAMLHIHK